MIRMIYKYPLEVEYRQVIALPGRTEALTVQIQNGQPCLWAFVEPDEPMEDHIFITVGTGHALDPEQSDETDGMAYLSTYQLDGGRLVFHVFEVL